MTPAKIMFAQKIRSVFDKQIPNKEKVKYTVQQSKNEFYEVGKKVFYQMYQTGKRYWEVGTIIKRIKRMIYLVKGLKMVHKRCLNPTKSRHIDEENDTPVDVLFDTFDVPLR